MNHRTLFILLFALTSFQCYSSFVFEAVGLASKLVEYGFKIKGMIEASDNSTKLENIKGKLDSMSEKMDTDLRQILTNQQIAPLLNKWWTLRIQFKGKMDAIYRDINRNLTEVESSSIANSVIGDSGDSIHQLIQKLHDTLFSHDSGALFNYMTENIQFVVNRKNYPADKLIYDLYLGVMSLEMQGAIGLEFQFDVFKHVNPIHNEDRRRIEKNNSIQRIETTKSKFKEYLKTKKFHIKNETYFISFYKSPITTFLSKYLGENKPKYIEHTIFLGELNADPGYVISDIKFHANITKTKYDNFYVTFVPSPLVHHIFWYPEIQQSKLDKYGLTDPTTSSWKSFESCQERTPLKDIQFANHHESENEKNSKALTGISMIRGSDGLVQIKKNYVRFNVETGALGEKFESWIPNEASCAEVKAADKSIVNSVVLEVNISENDSSVTLKSVRFDYSTLI